MRTDTQLIHQAHEEVGQILNLLLADEYALYKITRDYQWNVRGPDFPSRRLLFQLQHTATTEWVDKVTERIRQMQFDARISWADLQELARCSAVPGFGLPAERMLAELLRAHDKIIAQLHCDIEACQGRLDDAPTASFLTGLMEQHENAAWMLRAQLETPGTKSTPFSAGLN